MYAKRLSACPLSCLQEGIPNGNNPSGQSAADFGTDRLSALRPEIPAFRPSVLERADSSCCRPVASGSSAQSLVPILWQLVQAKGRTDLRGRFQARCNPVAAQIVERFGMFYENFQFWARSLARHRDSSPHSFGARRSYQALSSSPHARVGASRHRRTRAEY